MPGPRNWHSHYRSQIVGWRHEFSTVSSFFQFNQLNRSLHLLRVVLNRGGQVWTFGLSRETGLTEWGQVHHCWLPGQLSNCWGSVQLNRFTQQQRSSLRDLLGSTRRESRTFEIRKFWWSRRRRTNSAWCSSRLRPWRSAVEVERDLIRRQDRVLFLGEDLRRVYGYSPRRDPLWRARLRRRKWFHLELQRQDLCWWRSRRLWWRVLDRSWKMLDFETFSNWSRREFRLDQQLPSTELDFFRSYLDDRLRREVDNRKAVLVGQIMNRDSLDFRLKARWRLALRSRRRWDFALQVKKTRATRRYPRNWGFTSLNRATWRGPASVRARRHRRTRRKKWVNHQRFSLLSVPNQARTRAWFRPVLSRRERGHLRYPHFPSAVAAGGLRGKSYSLSYEVGRFELPFVFLFDSGTPPNAGPFGVIWSQHHHNCRAWSALVDHLWRGSRLAGVSLAFSRRFL